MNEKQPLDLNKVRARLAQSQGRQYWRALEEVAGTPEFEEMLQREFPRFASEWREHFSRRDFVKLMGASLALAGLSACSRVPTQPILPYSRPPQYGSPGNPLYFATAMPLGGTAVGLLVESHEGRPTKIEGNPGHPASLGGCDIFCQASVLGLYDPDRSQAVTHLGDIQTWTALVGEIQGRLGELKAQGGAGFHLLSETVISPTLGWQIKNFLKAYPEAKWHQYEPLGAHAARAGAQLAFGRHLDVVYDFSQADVIVALDADFLSCGPGSLRYARDFARRRRPQAGPNAAMSRLYVVESTPTNTGGLADHRLNTQSREVEAIARALAAAVGGGSSTAGSTGHEKWIAAVARDLQKHRGASIVITSEQQPPAVHALVHGINQALGNFGRTVRAMESIEAAPVDQMQSLRELAGDLDAGRVNWLVILGGNPVYGAPADLSFGDKIVKARTRIHLGQYQDETAVLCHWHVPEAHYLESWSDTRSYEGTASIIQPLIAPLYNGKTAHELLAVLSGQPEQNSYEIVRAYWKTQHAGADFEQFWRKSLNDGIVPNSAGTPANISAKPASRGDAASRQRSGQQKQTAHAQDLGAPMPEAQKPAEQPKHGLEIVFRPDPSTFDGRFANNGWLQELPKPISKVCWDNIVAMSPATAERYNLRYDVLAQGGEHGQISVDLVEVEYRGRKIQGPAWMMPGHAEDCVTVYLGYGRNHGGQVANGVGYNANVLRTSDGPWFGAGATLRATGAVHHLACTQFHNNMENRDLVRTATLEEFRREPLFAIKNESPLPKTLTLYPEYHYPGYKWGMVIDLNACIGCNACVIACQAENNIPVVGKSQVEAGREMHWIRVDRYYQGGLENPQTHFQPVPCMQCENAPCELVCPVGATVHSSEGLNDMVYNRCVGTRYCSNNCPYKVRRFNFFLYADWETTSLKLQRNPEVTVRSRGVMEKCTYCVQRITKGRIAAEEAERRVFDGEIVTACQQTCPSEAIIFGDLNDPKSRVRALREDPRDYSLLSELNTRPRTTYLAGVRNPNPEIEGA